MKRVCLRTSTMRWHVAVDPNPISSLPSGPTDPSPQRIDPPAPSNPRRVERGGAVATDTTSRFIGERIPFASPFKPKVDWKISLFTRDESGVSDARHRTRGNVPSPVEDARSYPSRSSTGAAVVVPPWGGSASCALIGQRIRRRINLPFLLVS